MVWVVYGVGGVPRPAYVRVCVYVLACGVGGGSRPSCVLAFGVDGGSRPALGPACVLAFGVDCGCWSARFNPEESYIHLKCAKTCPLRAPEGCFFIMAALRGIFVYALKCRAGLALRDWLQLSI